MSESKSRQKTKRKIIKIDEELCTGCGQCVIACAEGALEIRDGKAKVISDVFCDGLGACIGECPEGALTIEERVTYGFDEEAVEKHLENMKEEEKTENSHTHQCSCPSSQPIVYEEEWSEGDADEDIPSALRQWPTKIELVNPTAPYFNNNELVIVSDCSPVAYGDFHRKILRGKPIITVCPMLSLGEPELVKLEEILRENPVRKLNLVLMEVPCCQKIKIFLAPILAKVDKDIQVTQTIISRAGKILKEELIEL